MVEKTLKRAPQRINAHSCRRDAALADAAPALPLLDRFPRAPGPLRFPEPSSSLQNLRRNIFRSGIQTVGLAGCHKSCRAARATDPALCDAAPGPMHPAECKK